MYTWTEDIENKAKFQQETDTHDLINKLGRRGLDYITANYARLHGIYFNLDKNKIHYILLLPIMIITLITFLYYSFVSYNSDIMIYCLSIVLFLSIAQISFYHRLGSYKKELQEAKKVLDHIGITVCCNSSLDSTLGILAEERRLHFAITPEILDKKYIKIPTGPIDFKTYKNIFSYGQATFK